jgi:hypothetical protein
MFDQIKELKVVEFVTISLQSKLLQEERFLRLLLTNKLWAVSLTYWQHLL